MPEYRFTVFISLNQLRDNVNENIFIINRRPANEPKEIVPPLAAQFHNLNQVKIPRSQKIDFREPPSTRYLFLAQ